MFRTISRRFSSAPPPASAFNQKNLQIKLSSTPKAKTPLTELVFGHTFSDHMLMANWSRAEGGWTAPKIVPFANISLAPSACVFHYAVECFEGLKAYKDQSGHIRMFRPDMNMKRLCASAERLALPSFEEEELLACIKELLKVDSAWIPAERGYSLYLRPTIIGTQEWLGVGASEKAMLFVIASPVGPYYRTGFAAVSLKAETSFVRAWPGGTGNYKLGANYAPGIFPQIKAAEKGYQQILWLLGPEHNITEVGTMNCFIFWINEQGEKELLTPALDSTILPGVTRDSILTLTRGWNEFKVTEGRITMPQLVKAVESGKVLEMFGAGTATIVSPIKCINYLEKDYAIPLDPSDKSSQAGPLARRLWDAITKIQYGDVPHAWSVLVD